MEKSNLRVVFASDSNYMKSVENAIRVGEALLLCDVEESLDPELRPVLQKELTHRYNSRLFIVVVNDMLSAREVWGSITEPFLPDTVPLTVRRRCDVFSEFRR